MHGERAAPLRGGADGAGIAEHLAERHEAAHQFHAALVLHPFDATAPLADGTGGSPHVVLGHRDLHVHDRLEQFRIPLEEQVAEADARAFDEREFVRIHLVVGPVVDRDLHVHHRVPAARAMLHGLDDALFDGRNVFGRNVAALDLVFEHEPEPRVLRLDAQADMRVLAAST